MDGVLRLMGRFPQPLFELALVLVRLDPVASGILNLTWKRKRA